MGRGSGFTIGCANASRWHWGARPNQVLESLTARASRRREWVGRGYDSAKQVKGRKRHLLVDTQGLVLTVHVHPADVMDRDGVTRLLPPELTKAELPRLTHVWLDAAYNGQDKGRAWIEPHLGWTTHVVKPPPRRVLVAAHVEPTPRPAFTVLPRRWVVERTLAWLGQNRRLSKDYERFCESSEVMVYVAMSRLMVRRLAVP